ncbi:type III secretion protein HrpT [Brenneria izadpanahii]|uniref:Type III secretion protein HrpT n=1 Tax=Brenneria izadpanahii TaxID=2722756 RepID=A0ABX7UUE1_9GAMM|nr:HrpT family type III secretion system protein [Brenneria izadpanahii]QTF08192.1 type III secretion protein HrpT [Brenneria izadpanahii]
MWHKACLLILAVLLLSACSTSRQTANCTSVSCRPQPDARQLVIWWHPDLRTGQADYSKVTINE